MKQQIFILSLLLFGAFQLTAQQNEVTVEFTVECGVNGELDADRTIVRMEITRQDGKVDTIGFTFPKGTHARDIVNYFSDELEKKGIKTDSVVYNDKERKARFKIKNIKRVRVGTSLNGKLPVTFTTPPPPPTRRPDTLPPAVETGRMPRIKTVPLPTTPGTARPHKGPTTLPKPGQGSIQILVTQSESSSGRGGTTTMKVVISISATQGANSVDFRDTFPKGTTATAITKHFHDKLKKAGFDMKPYHPGDTQLFFNRVTKIDGSYSKDGARTTFGYSGPEVVVDDRGHQFSKFRVGVHYSVAQTEMAALNEYFDWINTTWNGNIAHLNTLQGVRIHPGTYMFTEHFGLGLGYRLLDGSTSGRSAGNPFETMLRSQGGYLFAVGEWSAGRFSISGECGAGYAGVTYTEMEAEWKQTANDAAPEYRAALQLGFRVAGGLHLVAGAEYQYLKFDDFGINWLSPGQPPVELDLSGPGFRVGLEYRF